MLAIVSRSGWSACNAYHIGDKSQSNGIRYRYRRTHIGTLKLNRIYVDRIDLISPCCGYLWYSDSCSYETDALRISHDVKYLWINLSNVSFDIIIFESTMLHVNYNFNDTILSMRFSEFRSVSWGNPCINYLYINIFINCYKSIVSMCRKLRNGMNSSNEAQWI